MDVSGFSNEGISKYLQVMKLPLINSSGTARFEQFCEEKTTGCLRKICSLILVKLR